MSCHVTIDNISHSIKNFQLNHFSTRAKDNTLIAHDNDEDNNQYEFEQIEIINL